MLYKSLLVNGTLWVTFPHHINWNLKDLKWEEQWKKVVPAVWWKLLENFCLLVSVCHRTAYGMSPDPDTQKDSRKPTAQQDMWCVPIPVLP